MNKAMHDRKTVKALCALMVFIIISIAAAHMPLFAAANPAKITVEQNFYNASVYASDTFSYVLRPLDMDAPMPPGSASSSTTGSTSGSASGSHSFTITGNSAYNITQMNFSKVGVYHYEIYQVIGTAKPGYTYDRRIYTLEFFVDANLVATMIAKESNRKVDKILFENTYTLSPTEPVHMADPLVVKTVSGSPVADADFSFTLTA